MFVHNSDWLFVSDWVQFFKELNTKDHMLTETNTLIKYWSFVKINYFVQYYKLIILPLLLYQCDKVTFVYFSSASCKVLSRLLMFFKATICNLTTTGGFENDTSQCMLICRTEQQFQ